MRSVLIALICIITSSCGHSVEKHDKLSYADSVKTDTTEDGYKKAYFASGCFWCVQGIYESVKGIEDVVVGYAGGKGENPNYNNYERKGHAESIEVTYDPEILDFETLLTVYFDSQDVVQQNGQGPDKGSGYRSIIFYENDKQKEIIKKAIKDVQNDYTRSVAAEVKPFKEFWKAEEMHQDFEKKNPNNAYIRNVSKPRINRFQNKHPDLLKKNE